MNTELFDLVDREWRGRLQASERMALEQRIAADPALAEEVAAYRSLLDTLAYAGEAQLQTELLATGKTLLQQGRTRQLRWTIAAAAAVVLMMALWLWPRPTTTCDNLYADAFRPAPIGTQGTAPTRDWVTAYALGAYDQAVVQIDALALAPTDALYIRAMYFKGVALMALDRHTEAATLLAALPVTGSMTDDILWYLALARIKTGMSDAALADLEALASRNNAYRTQARDLLQQLPCS
ncbi:MAG: hypothetical protein OHK0039_18670 [Bacteroidia bacterium]